MFADMHCAYCTAVIDNLDDYRDHLERYHKSSNAEINMLLTQIDLVHSYRKGKPACWAQSWSGGVRTADHKSAPEMITCPSCRVFEGLDR